MSNRRQTTELLDQLEADIKYLEIAYEQYFLGIEKRAPEKQRQKLALQMRKLLTRYIPQTDLKFRLRSLSSRFHSYSGYWDRIMRLIDEGRYERHVSRMQRTAESGKPSAPAAEEQATDPFDNLYQQLVEAHHSCALKAPQRQQVASFLDKQKSVIKEKFGDRQVDYVVVTEQGKPKIKVRAKN